MNELISQCGFDCPDGCAIRCVRDNGAVRLSGVTRDPASAGFICGRARRHPRRLTSPHRIREPWIKTDGRFHQATWDEAMALVASRVREAREIDPATVLLMRGYGNMGVSKGFTDFLFEKLGARTLEGSLCDGAGIAAIEADAGRLDMNDPRQLDLADRIILWGKNPLASSVHMATKVKQVRKRNAPVLAVTVDGASVKGLADEVILVRPGTDRFLALAAAKMLLRDQGDTAPWHRAANRQAFEALLDRHDVEELLRGCGVSRQQAETLARFYAASRKTATLCAWGLQRYRYGGQTVRALHALAFLAGTLGVRGGGFYYNISSSRHFHRPRAVSRAKPLCVTRLGSEIGHANPPLRFAWIARFNPLNQCADAKPLIAALDGVETVVAVEAFWTETARHATVVLPPALMMEEEDLAGSAYWNRIGAMRRIFEPPEGCRTDFDICRELAARLHLDTGFGEVDDWLRACLPPSAPSLEEIRRAGWAEMDYPAIAWSEDFAHPDGKFRLLEQLAPEMRPDPAHPLQLLSHVRRNVQHSQLLPEQQTELLPVRVHPETAAGYGMAFGDMVRVVSKVGELEGSLHVDPLLHPDCVAIPRGGWIGLGRGVNEITEPLATDMGDCVAFYQTGVRLEHA